MGGPLLGEPGTRARRIATRHNVQQPAPGYISDVTTTVDAETACAGRAAPRRARLRGSNHAIEVLIEECPVVGEKDP